MGPGRGTPERVTPLAIPSLAASLPRRVALETLRSHPLYDRQLEQELRQIERRLVPYLRRALERIEPVEPLRAGVALQLRSNQRRLRAGFCAFSCELFGRSYEAALPHAAAVECLQQFAQAHDDIVREALGDDEDTLLRRRFGLGHALNIGDLLLALGVECLTEADYEPWLKVRLTQVLAQYSLLAAAGQAVEIELRSAERPSLTRYLEASRLKVGGMLAMAVVGGAVIGGAGPRPQEILAGYALQAAVGLRIQDDLLDLDGRYGGQVGADIRAGRLSSVYLLAESRAQGSEQGRLRQIVLGRSSALEDPDLRWVLGLYQRTGAVASLRQLSHRLFHQALAQLHRFPDTPARRRLLHLSRRAVTAPRL